jgi:release factor glutamine methyltransferase
MTTADRQDAEPSVAGQPPGVTIEAVRRHLVRAFSERGLDSPDLDARLLVRHALGLDHAALAAQSRRLLSATEAAAVTALMIRRLGHEPVARIIGYKEFWGRRFALDRETLLPRPETETVIEASLAALAREPPGSPALRLADLGTGSGALLLSLLSELPQAYGIGTDLSHGALACARDNAAVLGLSARASFLACDYGTALRGPFDLIVSNPPYVARGDIDRLQSEVREFDPHRALDGGPDGLDGYRAIAGDVRRLLAPRGALVLELGHGQLAAVNRLFAATGLTPAGAPYRDLAGVARALVLRAPHERQALQDPKKALGLWPQTD